ncbi:MAG: LuxR C-terminal-related transcriptional regulator [Pseudomonadota bacterium]
MRDESLASDAPWVVESKFEPNRPRRELVHRDRLLRQLIEGEQRKLVLVTAPAGYGKSSLLGQWYAEKSGTSNCIAWLTLEPTEADAKQFSAYVVLALHRAGLAIDDLLIGARAGFADAAIQSVLSKLIAFINQHDAHIILVLEDYHNVDCDPVNAVVRQLLRDTRRNLTIFIDARRQPNIDAFSMIAAGDASEVNAAQLRLTQEETLQALADVVDREEADAIHHLTEGWPVAVQLARVQKRTRPSDPILSGVDGGLVASYLTEQILSTLDQDTQDLLLAVAFLDRFNPDLTNCVLQSSDAWARMNGLSSFAALIVPLDTKGAWYRLHHLFAEYLREMQRRRSVEKAKEILRRASAWYADRKETLEAVRYAAYAEDYKEGERIILEAGGWRVILTEGIGVLNNALRLVPDDVIQASSRLMSARAYLHCKFGEIAEARAALNAAAKLSSDRNDVQCNVDRMLVESLVNLYEDRTDWSVDHRALREKYTDSGLLDSLSRGTMRCEDILVAIGVADLAAASVYLREAFALMRESGSVLGLNYCYLHASHLALHRGDLATAALNVERASELADENFGSDSGLKAAATVMQIAVRCWQGDFARDDLALLRDALLHTIDNDGWVDLYITGFLAAARLARVFSDPSVLQEITGRFRLVAEQRTLTRLSTFLTCYDDFSSGYPGDQRSKGDILDRAKTLCTAYAADERRRDWQSVCAAGCFLAEHGEDGQAIALYEAVYASSQDNGTQLWTYRLALARLLAAYRAGDTDMAKASCLELVDSTAPLGLRGLFLADELSIRILRELRSELRQNEAELLKLQFVNQVLERWAAIKPHTTPGILTEREFEVLEKLSQGLSNKEIARELELTENTVKFHLKSVFAKLSVSKRSQAIIEAQRRGLIA